MMIHVYGLLSDYRPKNAIDLWIKKNTDMRKNSRKQTFLKIQIW